MLLLGCAGLFLLSVFQPTVASSPGSRFAYGVGTWHAPYRKMGLTPGESTTVLGCGSVNATKPIFSPKTGKGSWNASVNSSPCAHPGSGYYVQSSAFSEFELQLPIKVPSGRHNFTTRWALSATLVSQLHWNGTCPAAAIPKHGFSQQICEVGGFAYVFYQAELDLASGQAVAYAQSGYLLYNSSQISDQTTCYNATNTSSGYCAYSNYTSPNGSGNFHGFSNAVLKIRPPHPLKARDSYFLTLYIQADLGTWVWAEPMPGILGSSASASLDYGHVGRGIALTSFSVS